MTDKISDYDRITLHRNDPLLQPIAGYDMGGVKRVGVSIPLGGRPAAFSTSFAMRILSLQAAAAAAVVFFVLKLT